MQGSRKEDEDYEYMQSQSPVVELTARKKRIRPLIGEVLLYMDAFKEESEGGIVIPEKHRERSQFGEVRRLGIWRQNKHGSLMPFPVAPGDRVMVRAASGRWLHSAKERLKLVNATDILAIVEED